MQGGRRGRDNVFNSDPFAGFGGFGDPRNLMSSFFGGRDPFDDPFFTRPFGGIFESMESRFFGGSPFPNVVPFGLMGRPAFPDMAPFGIMGGEAAPDMTPFEFTDHQALRNMSPSAFIDPDAPVPKKPRGPIIEEINSDEEKGEADKEEEENPRKHGRSDKEAYVDNPEEEKFEEQRNRQLEFSNNNNRSDGVQRQPQSHSFTFQSSTVTYGGANGAYYTSSTTKRTGNDGLTFEERREADSTTKEASHSIHRGLHNKGHSVRRRLNSDGRVDTMQILHNLNEDELTGFEDSWKGNAPKHLPGWNECFISSGSNSSSWNGQARQEGGWALPSVARPQSSNGVTSDVRDGAGSSHAQRSGRTTGDGGMAGYLQRGVSD